jgi:HAMP domain-containing protein
MTPPPPAATAAPRASALRRPGGRIPRRISGPVRSPSVSRTQGGALALPRGLELPRISPRALAASAAWQLRAALGGRGLIVVLAGLLLGLVFLQVSLLKLNTRISQSVEAAHELERGNAALRTTISRLDAGQRIQDAAGGLGLVMPGPGSVCYLDARRGGPCSGGDPTAAASAADALPAQSAAPAVTATPAPQATTPAQQPASATVQPDPVQAQPAQPQAPAPAAAPAPIPPAPVQQPAAAPEQTAVASPQQAQPTGGLSVGAAE